MTFADPNGPAAELAQLSLMELSDRIAAKQMSCWEAVEGYLARIEAYDGSDGINAYITVAADEALAEADRLDALLAEGIHLGPLHGVPIAIKDNLETASLKTTGGSTILVENVPATDATAVAKLKEAGAIILGKTNMHELAFGITSNNPHYGPVRNPYDLSRIAGGSSGGSGAAVVAGLCAAAIGTDTGGSIRIPAALCGAIGLKPTLGRVGRGGLIALSETCDCIGPITKTAEDAALVLQALIGPDERDPITASDATANFQPNTGSWQGVRLGIPRGLFYDDLDPAVTEVMDQALKQMENAGATLVEVRIDGLDGVVPSGFAIVLSETVHLLGGYLGRLDPPLTIPDILDQLGPDVNAILGGQVGPEAQPIPGHVYLDSVNTFRSALTVSFLSALDRVDALVTPTVPLPAAPIGQDAEVSHNRQNAPTFLTYVRNTFPVSLAGLPALTVPVGHNETGLPLGMQFIGQPWQEAKLLQLGHNWMTSY